MHRHWIRATVLVVLLALPWVLAARAGKKKEKQSGELPSLQYLLDRLDRVAALYRDNALSFTCDETIHHAGRGNPSILKFRYIYRYSEEKQALDDYRILRGRKSELSPEKKEKIALDHYGLPQFLVRAYSWVFLFEESLWKYQSFAIEGEGDWQGRPAILLRFEPLEAYRQDSDLWYGTAWVDRETFHLLHVEAIETEDYPQYRLAHRLMREGRDAATFNYRGAFTYSVCSTDFDVVKHGMRFPGRNVIRRSQYHARSGAGRESLDEDPLYNVTQVYSRYKFFSVRTEEEIRSAVIADR